MSALLELLLLLLEQQRALPGVAHARLSHRRAVTPSSPLAPGHAPTAVLKSGLDRGAERDQWVLHPVALTEAQAEFESSVEQSPQAQSVRRAFETRFGGSLGEVLRHRRCAHLVRMGAIGAVTHAVARLDLILGAAVCRLVQGNLPPVPAPVPPPPAGTKGDDLEPGARKLVALLLLLLG